MTKSTQISVVLNFCRVYCVRSSCCQNFKSFPLLLFPSASRDKKKSIQVHLGLTWAPESDQYYKSNRLGQESDQSDQSDRFGQDSDQSDESDCFPLLAPIHLRSTRQSDGFGALEGGGGSREPDPL